MEEKKSGHPSLLKKKSGEKKSGHPSLFELLDMGEAQAGKSWVSALLLCGARRMADSAALLVDEALPHQPMRQWVLSVRFRFAFCMQFYWL